MNFASEGLCYELYACLRQESLNSQKYHGFAVEPWDEFQEYLLANRAVLYWNHAVITIPLRYVWAGANLLTWNNLNPNMDK